MAFEGVVEEEPPQEEEAGAPLEEVDEGDLPYQDYLAGLDAGNFNYLDYIDSIPNGEKLLRVAEGRRTLCKYDPMLFALLYLGHHLKDRDKRITFSDAHFDWFRDGLRWVRKVSEPQMNRRAYISPRESGKSTFFFLILPLWAAAHGHSAFIAAFADSATQAETHLQTFREELEFNKLLREDHPMLCKPARRLSGVTISDNRSTWQSQSKFTFMARGIDSSTLGLKVNEMRPDMLIFDDVEPDEANYSQNQADKRLGTIQDSILPMNVYAKVVFVGTVTMSSSIMHQLVRSIYETPEEWIGGEKIRAKHYDAIVTNEEGVERSIWPSKWPYEFLNSIRHTRSYKKNYANNPMGRDGEYWLDTDFIYADLEGITRTLLSIDPATTTKATSDPTGLAVVSYSPPRRMSPADQIESRTTGYASPAVGRCAVLAAGEVKFVGERLRKEVLKILKLYPQIRKVIVESNQGGEHWHSILHDVPVTVEILSNTAPKDVRAANLLDHYQRRRVFHPKRLTRAEEQMVGFPRAPHDDMVDAIGTGVAYFLDKPKPLKGSATVTSYLPKR